MPKVTVCLCAFNAEKWIAEAISSVLGQTLGDFELLIHENGSTDGTRKVIESFSDPRISVVYSVANQGSFIGYKVLQDAATGEYLAMLGADDVLEADSLEKRSKWLDENPDDVMVFSHPHFINEDGSDFKDETHPLVRIRKVTNASRDEWKQRFKLANYFNTSQCMYRNGLHAKVGYEPLGLELLNDLDLYISALEAGGIHVIEEPLVRVMVHPKSESAPTLEKIKAHIADLQKIRKVRYARKDGKMKLMIATPFYDVKGYSPYIKCLVQTIYTLARHTTMEFEYVEMSGGSYIDHNRNLLAMKFLDSDCTDLFFIDSDEGWDVPGFLNVMKSDKEVVGAAYPVKNNWEQWGVTIHSDENNGFRAIRDENGLIKADKVPTGFMKIKRLVFEKLIEANPDDWYFNTGPERPDDRVWNFFGHLTIDRIRYGEDISFGIRWQRIGGEVWVEPRVTIGHYGTKEWMGNYDKYLRSQPGGDLDPAKLEAA